VQRHASGEDLVDVLVGRDHRPADGERIHVLFFPTPVRTHLGLSPDVLFRTVDLTEGRDLFSVTATLRALGRKVL